MSARGHGLLLDAESETLGVELIQELGMDLEWFWLKRVRSITSVGEAACCCLCQAKVAIGKRGGGGSYR